jgi:hypothetical protein
MHEITSNPATSEPASLHPHRTVVGIAEVTQVVHALVTYPDVPFPLVLPGQLEVPCDKAAVCTGLSSVCPDNPIKPASTVCGSSQPCKQQPFCDGRNAKCPGGSNRPERTPCLRDGAVAQYPISQAGRMSLDACKGQCMTGACQLRLNKQGCCYTSEQVNKKTVRTVHCW